MELERYDQDMHIPTIALDQEDRSCIQEILTMYASVLQLLPLSKDGRLLLETIHQLHTKLDALATMQADETLDIDILSNHALQMAFTFHLRMIPLLHLDPVQEQDLINGIKHLQAHLRGEHVILSTGDTLERDVQD